MGKGEEETTQYGTFQGVPVPPPPHTSIGFPQPTPPPGFPGSVPTPPSYYSHGYQGLPVTVVEVAYVREPRLPCCGIGFGWFLFILGFFVVAIPWYAGAIILMCSRVDHREKAGYVACTIAAIIAAITIPLGVTTGTHSW